MPPRHEKEITPTEAFRAIYFDFEGFVDKPPSLLGWACEFDFNQVVLDPRLAVAARAKRLRVLTLEKAMEELMSRCEAEKRHLVAFSQGEKQTVRMFASIDLEPLYKDAHKISKRWANRLHRGRVEQYRLKDFLELLGYDWPTYLGDGKATHRLRGVLSGLESRESYEKLTGTQKAKWSKLLQYNQIDCLGMRDLVLRAAAELALAQKHRIFER